MGTSQARTTIGRRWSSTQTGSRSGTSADRSASRLEMCQRCPNGSITHPARVPGSGPSETGRSIVAPSSASRKTKVSVIDRDRQRHRVAAESERALDTHDGPLVGKEELRAADEELRVPQRPVVIPQAERLPRGKGPGVELERRGATVHGQVGDNGFRHRCFVICVHRSTQTWSVDSAAGGRSVPTNGDGRAHEVGRQLDRVSRRRAPDSLSSREWR